MKRAQLKPKKARILRILMVLVLATFAALANLKQELPKVCHIPPTLNYSELREKLSSNLWDSADQSYFVLLISAQRYQRFESDMELPGYRLHYFNISQSSNILYVLGGDFYIENSIVILHKGKCPHNLCIAVFIPYRLPKFII